MGAAEGEFESEGEGRVEVGSGSVVGEEVVGRYLFPDH